MKFITKGKDYKFTYQAVNNSGGVIDLTSSDITSKIKNDRSSITVQSQKDLTDGVTVISASNGLFSVEWDRVDLQGLNETTYHQIIISNGDDDYSIEEVWKTTDGASLTGDIEEDNSVIADKYYEASIGSDGSESVSVESGWDGDITPTRQSTGLFHISSSSEFTSNKTSIEVSTAETGITVTTEHYSTSLIKVRVYDAQGSLYDSQFIISVKVY